MISAKEPPSSSSSATTINDHTSSPASIAVSGINYFVFCLLIPIQLVDLVHEMFCVIRDRSCEKVVNAILVEQVKEIAVDVDRGIKKDACDAKPQRPQQ